MHVADRRSILGALSMLMVGAILSVLAWQYFSSGEEGYAIIRSRLWWELVLNLQVVCGAIMWFCHIDRVSELEGPRQRVARLEMVAGIIVVLLPTWVALLAAGLDWFVERPSALAIDRVIAFCIFWWAFSNFLPWYLKRRTRGRWPKPHWLQRSLLGNLIAYSPMIVALVLMLYDQVVGGLVHFMATPFLFYLQGARPYIYRAFGFRV